MDNFNAFYKKYKTVFPTQTRAGMLNLLYHQRLYEAKLEFVLRPFFAKVETYAVFIINKQIKPRFAVTRTSLNNKTAGEN